MPAAQRNKDVRAWIDTAVVRWNVVAHPFHEAWIRGELEPRQLARYAAAYRWPVLALAATAELAGGSADEAYEHVMRWEQFAAACGLSRSEPSRAAAQSALAWLAGRDQLERLAVLHAVESMRPASAEAKLTALIDHYGFEVGPAIDYFVVQLQRESEHGARLAAEARPRDGARLGRVAEAALAANWRLLDEVAGQAA